MTQGKPFRRALGTVISVLFAAFLAPSEALQARMLERVNLASSLSGPSVLRQRTADAPQNWQLLPSGYGGGGRFTSISLERIGLGSILIGSDVAGVFKSEDAGGGFQLTGKSLEGFAVADMAVSPHNPKLTLLLTDDGFYVSEDQGGSWQKRSSQIRYNARRAGSRLIVFSQDTTYVATDSDGVFRITLGESDIQAERLSGLESSQITCLAFHANGLYAGTLQGSYRFSNGQWHLNEGLNAAQSQVVDLVPASEGRLFLVEKTSGVYVLDSMSGAWTPRGKPALQPGTFKALAVSPANPNLLLLASHPDSWPYRLFKSTDGGTTWKSLESFQTDALAAHNLASSLCSVEEIAFSVDAPQQVWLTDWWNVWRSTDEGENWTQVHRGLQNTVVNDIKVHPTHQETLYASVADNGLMVSPDGGKTWRRQMTGVLDGHVQEVEISPLDPSKIYLLAQPWGRRDRVFVYKSVDSGMTWQDISFPIPEQTLPKLAYVDGLSTNLELDPSADETVYVGSNGYGVFKSTDGGKSWRHASTGMTTPYIKGPRALLIHPRDSRILFASTLAGGIYRSTDGAQTWKPISPSFSFTFGMAIDPSNPNRILAARPEKRVLVSEDGGSQWKEVSLPGLLPPHIASYAISISPSDPKRVAVGTLGYDYKAADGLFLSADGGYTYQACASALPRVSINTLESTSNPERPLLIGFNGIGLFKGALP